MFSLHDFVMKTLSTMKNRLDEYQVRTYALSWYSKSVLTDDDMSTIDNWYTSDNEVIENSNGDLAEEVAKDTENNESEEV